MGESSSADVIRKRLNHPKGRKAIYRIVKRGNREELGRTMRLFSDYGMKPEIGKLIDWCIKRDLGVLKVSTIRF